LALIRILCDGGGILGFGNLRRSAILGRALAARGHGVRVEALSEQGRALLPSAPSDAGEADVLVLDLPYAADDWVRSARAPVVGLDYTGEASPDVSISIWQRGTASGGGRMLVGLDYAIIGPEIVALAGRKDGDCVTVMIGGGDADGLAEEVALRLIGLGESRVTLIEGPLAVVRRELPPSVRRLRSPADLEQRMASCNWAVTSGGTSMMELMCLGKAIHVVPRTKFEEGLARQVLARGGLLGVGFESLALPTPERQAQVGAQAASLIDGRGAERIGDIIESLL
jgi:spore coat polysaccharide biosynthesis predicted glycosyltransferase SpsG